MREKKKLWDKFSKKDTAVSQAEDSKGKKTTITPKKDEAIVVEPTVTVEKLPDAIADHIEHITVLENKMAVARKRASNAKNLAIEARHRPATFFGRRKAIEALQESSLGLANAHADMMDAFALSFADQRKIGEILNQMLLLCVSNLAGTRSLINQLEAGLRKVEKGDYSEETKQEMKRIIRDLKAQEDLMIRQEKQAEALRKYGTQLQAAEDHLHEQDERHAETVEEVARTNELAVSNRKKLDEIRGKMQATEDALAASRKRQNVLFCTVVVLILITIIQFFI